MAETSYRIRISKNNDEVSFKYPIRHILGDEELRSFLNESELALSDYELTRFLSIGKTLKLDGIKYRVVDIYLKLHDFELQEFEGSQVDILIKVEAV